MTLKLVPFVLLLHAFLLQYCKGATIAGCIANERNALLNFKKVLKDKYNRLASWKDEDCCNWQGVSCNNVTGHVVRLDLRNPHHFSDTDNILYNEWSLRGRLSPSLLGLKHLNYLDLSMNHFDGTIPKFVGSLHNLRYLNLSLAGFNGLIPHHLGNLSRLEYLDLNNGWNGYGSEAIIDDSHWISRLTSLRHLTMKNTKFENFQNWVEALNMLPNIAEICLSSCNITVFPLSLPYVNFTNLSYLDLSENDIDLEMIPLWLFNIKSLTHIDLHYNFFRSIPDALKNLTFLGYIDFSFNKLNGIVPKSVGQLSNLVHLNLDENLLEGVISEAHFASLTKLKELNLQSNNLILNVSDDWIPPFMLNFIDMGSCKLGPNFPAWLQTQSSISFLNLSGSGIVDSLPNWFWDVFASNEKCIKLDLSNNGITGSLPPLSKLCFYYFDLSSNFFEGPLPPSLNMSGYVVDISNNSFSGSIQPIIGNQTLSYLFLSNNKFSGAIPSSICLADVRWMDLSHNLLTGELPNCWNPLTYSSQYSAPVLIDFCRNNLSGSIPDTIGTLTSLKSLHLGDNNLSGNIPTTLRNCINLITLELSRNKLRGIIPTWIGENLTSLKFLILRSNNFTENVPSNLSKLRNLQILDLSNNKLSGRIPRSFENFTIMMDIHTNDEDTRYLGFYDGILPYLTEYLPLTVKGRDWNYDKLLTQITIIDLSCNSLSGQIPKELGNLHGLNFLNLSRNHLAGSMPDEIGLMHSLESLDFSRNRLSGILPLSMSTMTTLDFLNLSYNNLSGMIPLGNQLQTFTNDSYIGNPKLCGFPLIQSCDSNKTKNVEVSVVNLTNSDYWYVSIASGFVFGFWIVWVTFIFKKNWKDAYFWYVDYMYDAIYVAIAVKLNMFKRNFDNEITFG